MMRLANTTWKLLWRALVTILLLICVAPEGFAQSYDDLDSATQKQFAKLLDKCIKAYDRNRFDDAEALCGEATAIIPHPAAAYVVARIRDRSGQCDVAVEIYRRVLETEPVGASETRWLEEYKPSIEENLSALGDCSARIDVTCEDEGGHVTVGPKVLGKCPGVFTTTVGNIGVTLSSPGKKAATQNVEAVSGRAQPVTFKALDPADAGTLTVACPEFKNGAVLFVDEVSVGECPDVLSLPKGKQRIVAKDSTGKRGLSVIDVEPSTAQQTEVMPFRKIAVECDDPELSLKLVNEGAENDIDAPCAEVAQTGGLFLIDGNYELVLSREDQQPVKLPFEVNGEPTKPLKIGALDRLPVAFSVTCEGEGVFVRIGSKTGPCPLEGTLERGNYILEARQEGHEPNDQKVELELGGQNTFHVPALEEQSFFTAGNVTAMVGGAVLIAAIAVDVSGLSDLDRVDQIKATDLSLLSVEEKAKLKIEWDGLKSAYTTRVWTTRILYPIGIAAAATGVGLIVYDLMNSSPGDFTGPEEASWTPQVLPLATADQAGAFLRWSF